MEHTVRVHITNAAIVVAVGAAVSVITSTFVASRAYQARGEQAVRREQTIFVKGSTRQRIRSDRAVWQIRVEGEGQTLQAAFETLDAGANRIRGFLAERGFQDPEIGVGAIDTGTHYARDAKGNSTREVTGYSLSRTFVVATGDVARVSQAAGRVTQLIQEGVHVISFQPEYYYTKLPDLKVALMGAATQDARARAENIARNAGCRVGEVRDAHMGVLQITRPESMEISSYGIFNTTSIDKDVRAVVTVTFGITPA